MTYRLKNFLRKILRNHQTLQFGGSSSGRLILLVSATFPHQK